jgi:hypothetical protein
MYDTVADVPTEYQKPSISKAAIIVGLDRANFYRSHINPGKISVSIDETGTKYIDFIELIRVFGLEKCLAGVKNLTSKVNTSYTDGKTQSETGNEQIDYTSETVTLQIENSKLRAELQGLKQLSEDRHATILEQREQLRKHFDELQATRRLLEDKQSKTVPIGLLARLKGLFT